MEKFLLVAAGIGLFLLGMSLMTEGLRAVSGTWLPKLLARFTRSPVSGAISGALSTAALQSSSATILVAIGFVSAGLLSFGHALGILFGANIGTTITGWLVVLIGFKLKLADLLMPLIPLGALLQIFGKTKRLLALAKILAGFGILFLGFSMIQQGMTDFREILTPAIFPSDTLSGRFLLLLLGIAMTLVTQSSSVGVATALAALAVDSISFAQAAALVVGMDIGTTATALFGAIGSNLQARRTAISHVIYNLMTGTFAFLLLKTYENVWFGAFKTGFWSAQEIALVAFHTLFNLLGVLLVLPWTHQFARLIEYILPERKDQRTARLDPSLLKNPDTALLVSATTLAELAVQLMTTFKQVATGGTAVYTLQAFNDIQQTLSSLRQYAGSIKTDHATEKTQRAHLALMHALEHFSRLANRIEHMDDITVFDKRPTLRQALEETIEHFAQVAAAMQSPDIVTSTEAVQTFWQTLNRQTETYRNTVLAEMSNGALRVETGYEILHAQRWLRRVSYHLWRLAYHFQVAEKVVDPFLKKPPALKPTDPTA